MFDPTLNGVMAQVDAGKIVLPAMQRPFVWKDDRITKLVDSLLRGFFAGKRAHSGWNESCRLPRSVRD